MAVTDEEYYGYAVMFRGERACVAYNGGAVEQFVCWLYDLDGKGVHSGHYSNNRFSVYKKYCEREDVAVVDKMALNECLTGI
ncbi:hypothetical protein FACS1894188_11460 [Clostridia bacterium]|nr:hypothetical protein FACS1894188_11460 [Clostridia bacterium]